MEGYLILKIKLAHIFLLLFFSSVVIVVTLATRFVESDSIERSTQYKYLMCNSITNESSSGFVSIPEVFENEEFFSSSFDEGVNFLISQVGTVEYRCFGSCHCEDSLERRNSARLSSSVSYLVAAVSSIIALRKASDFFQEECLRVLMEDEECSNVISEVDSCNNLETRDNEETEVKTRDGFRKRDIRKYSCNGLCLPKKFSREKTRKLAEEFNCNRLRKDAVFDVDVTGMKTTSTTSHSRDVFQSDHLRPFCKEKSQVHYRYYNFLNNSWKIFVRLCVAGNARTNPTIHCRQIYPRYASVPNSLRYF